MTIESCREKNCSRLCETNGINLPKYVCLGIDRTTIGVWTNSIDIITPEQCERLFKLKQEMKTNL